ncbi:MAG: hypothetical protein ACREKN_03815 [Longimicrobiaceae bacterium]
MPIRQLAVLALLLPAVAGAANAQEGALPSTNLRLFLDCSGFFCDQDYYQTEIDFVDFVRRREDATVHLLITTQRTGAGGLEYTLAFLGQEELEGEDLTLRHVSGATATEDERRSGLAQVMKLGLVGYAAGTPAGQRLQVSYTPPGDEVADGEVAGDPWNRWTFRTSLRGFFNGESRISSRSLSGSVSASRTTEVWKTRLSLSGNDRKSSFEIDSLTTVESTSRSYGLSGLAVRGLNDNWSVGGRASATSSTFLNQDLALRLAPGVEYSVFPYGESTRRLLTLQYAVGINSFDYEEETIFGKRAEVLFDQSLVASLDVKQPWGSADVSLEGNQYLHDFSKYRTELSGSLDVRLWKGLSLDLFGNVAYLRDQLFLSAGDATDEEILLRQRQLQTDYRYFLSLGLSYTFGSIFSDVVNPRFGGSGGGGTIFFF